MSDSNCTNRRQVLKAVAGTTAASTVIGTASASGSDADMNVYLHPNSAGEKYDAEELTGYISQSLSQLVQNTGVGSYDIEVVDMETNFGSYYPEIYGDNRREVFNQWREYINSTGRRDEVGCHLLVTSQFSGGMAEGGDHQKNSNHRKPSFVVGHACCIFGGSGGRWYGGAIQEILHSFIDQGLVEDLLYGDNDQHEDQLGTVRNNGAVTPMAAGYTENRDGKHDAAYDGACQPPEWVHWDGSYTTKLSACTEIAVDRSYEHYS